MRSALLVVLSVTLFVAAAKAHGRELRLEREAAGFHSVSFGGQNPPFVESLWREERVRFWVLTSALAVLVGVIMLRRGASPWLTALVVLTWIPSVSFLGLGLASLARHGLGARSAGALAGSAAWWALVVAAGLGAVAVSRPLLR